MKPAAPVCSYVPFTVLNMLYSPSFIDSSFDTRRPLCPVVNVLHRRAQLSLSCLTACTPALPGCPHASEPHPRSNALPTPHRTYQRDISRASGERLDDPKAIDASGKRVQVTLPALAALEGELSHTFFSDQGHFIDTALLLSPTPRRSPLLTQSARPNDFV